MGVNNLRSQMDNQLAMKADTANVYGKNETHTQSEVNDIVGKKVSDLRSQMHDKLAMKADTGDVYRKNETHTQKEVMHKGRASTKRTTDREFHCILPSLGATAGTDGTC